MIIGIADSIESNHSWFTVVHYHYAACIVETSVFVLDRKGAPPKVSKWFAYCKVVLVHSVKSSAQAVLQQHLAEHTKEKTVVYKVLDLLPNWWAL